MSRCLITGCRLVIPAEGKSLWGDLHELAGGDVLVFAGNVQGADNRAVWEYKAKSREDEMQVVIDTDDYYERRGIVTIGVKDVHFNEYAFKYLI